MSGYRDDQSVVRDEIAALEQEVAQLRASLPEQLMGFLGDDILARTNAEPPAGDGHVRLEALHSIAGAWRDAVAQIPQLERMAQQIAPGAPALKGHDFRGQRTEPGWTEKVVFEPPGEVLELLTKVGATHAEIKWYAVKAQEQDLFGPRTYLWTQASCAVRYQQTPMRLVVEHGQFLAAVHLARGATELTLTPEGYSDGLLKALRLLREIEIGESGFDGTFLFRSNDPDGARTVIDERVRQGLMQIARYDVPRLTIKDDTATIRWRFGWEPHLIIETLDLLVALRRTSLGIHQDAEAARVARVASLRDAISKIKARFTEEQERELDLDPDREVPVEDDLEPLQRCLDAWRSAMVVLSRPKPAETQAVRPGYPEVSVPHRAARVKQLPAAYQKVIDATLSSIARQIWTADNEDAWMPEVGEVDFRYKDVAMCLVAQKHRFRALCLVAQRSPKVSVRPQSYRDGMAKKMGLQREITVGDSEFDERFFFRASDTSLAVALIDEMTRRQLLRVSRFDVPELTIRDGVAEICWRYEPNAVLWTEVFETLARLHKTSVTLPTEGT